MQIVRVLALLAACIAVGCAIDLPGAEGGPGPGGASGEGGAGGEGGDAGDGGDGGCTSGPGGSGGETTPPPREVACERLCHKQAECGAIDSPAACVAACLADTVFPVEVVAACAACLEPLSCEALPHACRSACSLPRHDLVVAGTGFSPFAGRTLWLLLHEAQRGVVEAGFVELGSGNEFHVTVPRALLQGGRYTLDLFLDATDDGLCRPDAGDLVWRLPLPAIEGDTVVPLSPATPQFALACPAFSVIPTDLVVEGSGFDAPAGRVVVSVVEHHGGYEYPVGQLETELEDGRFSLRLPRVLWQGSSFDVAWFVDEGGGLCGPEDIGGLVHLPSTRGHERVEVTPEEGAGPLCLLFPGWNHDLAVQGYGAPPGWEGSWLLAVLFADGQRVIDHDWFEVRDGAFAVDFPGSLAAGERYRLVLFRDGDRNWSCSVPPDAIWSMEFDQIEGDLHVEAHVPSSWEPALCAWLHGT